MKCCQRHHRTARGGPKQTQGPTVSGTHVTIVTASTHSSPARAPCVWMLLYNTHARTPVHDTKVQTLTQRASVPQQLYIQRTYKAVPRVHTVGCVSLSFAHCDRCMLVTPELVPSSVHALCLSSTFRPHLRCRTHRLLPLSSEPLTAARPVGATLSETAQASHTHPYAGRSV